MQRQFPSQRLWRWALRLRRRLGHWVDQTYLVLVCVPVSAGQVLYARLRMRPPRSVPQPEAPPQRLLVIALDHLGDTALAAPLVLELRDRFPAAAITLVIRAVNAPLFDSWSGCRILKAEVTNNKLARWLVLPGRRYRFARDFLWREQFDAALVARVGSDYHGSVLLAYFSRAPVRVAITEKARYVKVRQNWGYDRLLTAAVPARAEHEADIMLALASALGPVPVPARRRRLPLHNPAWAAAMLPGPTPWIALCPSPGTSELKQWGVGRWANVAQELSRRGFGVALIGARADAELGRSIAAAVPGPCANLAGVTSLPQLTSVLARCILFVGNDCGPMHLASAMNRPTVGVMGSSFVNRYGAWSDDAISLKVELPCSPSLDYGRERCRFCCYPFPRCLEEISPMEVVNAVMELLRRAGLAEVVDGRSAPGPGAVDLQERHLQAQVLLP